MLRRPLHQVVVTLTRPIPLFAHCLLATFGTEPDMTITSHGNALVVGGRVASDPEPSSADRIDAVRHGLASILPAIDLTGATFRTFAAVRAEPARHGLWDSGDVFAERRGNCVLCWPVKLSLAPRLGDVVANLLADLQPRPRAWHGNAERLPHYAEPPYAAGHRGAIATNAMLKRPLGNSGLAVSPLGLGTVKFGRNSGVKYPRPFELPSDAQIADLLALAHSLGINLLDTAPAYGASEERLGEAIAGNRERWLLCTKAGEEFIDGRSR